MDAERVLPHQSVLVRNGLITQVGPSSETAVPPGATVVRGEGKRYLLPGLADLHTHADTTEDLLSYLSNGVTTTLNLGLASEGFVQVIRPLVETGEVVGPHCYAALLVDGARGLGHLAITSPADARAIVRLAQADGYDFIKVYNALSAEAFFALMDEARERHFPIAGHGVRAVGLERQLQAGQVLVAHAEEYLNTTFRDGLDERRIPAAVAFTRRSGAYVAPTLSTYAAIARQWGKPNALREILAGPETAWLRPETIRDWMEGFYAKRTGNLDRQYAFLRRFVKALADGGVPLVTGTDSPVVPGMAPGVSLRAEIEELTRAGLSRFEALVAATRAPGELIHRYLPGAPLVGIVAAGQRADLLLLDGNPLESTAALSRIEGVMLAGRWHSRASLDAAMTAQRRLYEEAEALRRRPLFPATR
jgi:imidazolonepropionase-like amidohydrolase